MTIVPKSVFSRALVRLNHLESRGFERWLFHRGMEFESRHKWWHGGADKRPAPHEGLDLCCFENREGKEVFLGEDTLVPAMYDGEIVKVFPDFLGYSIMVVHGFQTRDRQLYSIYAHTRPLAALGPGSLVKAGEPLAAINSSANKNIRPHLHLSVMWGTAATIAEFAWQTMHKLVDVVLCNPRDFF